MFKSFLVTLLAVSSLHLLFVSASVGWNECTKNFVSTSYVPHLPPKSVRICRSGDLAIGYDQTMQNPALSIYKRTHADIENNIPGRDDFYQDPDLQALGVQQPSVDSPAYKEPFNKGHCAPSKIMSSSASSKKSCYTVANIAPQYGTFNIGSWQDLEEHVFDWIKSSGKDLYIITGVAYDSRGDAPRHDGVAVPSYYFKVFCDKSSKKSAGFYGRNEEDGPKKISEMYRSVKEVETLYGGTLFPDSECKTDDVEPSHWWG